MPVQYSQSQGFPLDTEMNSGFSGPGREICFGQSSSISLCFLSLCCLCPPNSHPSFFFHCSRSYLFRQCLTRRIFSFVFPGSGSSHLLERRAKEDEGLKVCGGKFLEDVSGLCSQGTSCSQCEHGTLSMRSISMTIIFILQQSGSRQHSCTGGEEKRSPSHPIRYTFCNILAVNITKP